MKMKKTLLALSMACIMLFATACSNGTPKPDHDLLTDYYDYNPDEYIKLGDYKNIVVKMRDPEATEKEIEEYIVGFLDKYSTMTEVTDRDTVKLGDVANIDYKGFVDGQSPSSMKDEGCNLEIGSGSFIPGFEDQLIGAKVGTEIGINVTFPKDYWNSSMAGKQALFNVTINTIYEKITPELTDELVAEKTDCETVEEYRKYVKEKITASNQSANDKQYESLVWENAVESTEVLKYPEGLLAECRSLSEAYITQVAQHYNMELSTYVTSILGMTMDEFNEKLDENAKSAAKQKLILYAVTNTENIHITWDEYRKLAEDYFDDLSVDSFEELEEKYERKDICEDMAFNKLLDLLVENATIEYTTEE